jgi:hypothetical protein
MQKGKTRSNFGELAGLQGVFNFEQNPSSPFIPNYQLAGMCSYRIDPQLIVQPIWRRHHG